MNFNLLFVICIAFIFATVNVQTPELPPLEEETLFAMCKVNESVSRCGWYNLEKLGQQPVEVVPGAKLRKGIKYHGKGLEYGECGITILKVLRNYDGPLSCQALLTKTEVYEECENITPIVIKPPRINVTRVNLAKREYSQDIFKENETIQAECEIEYKPPAPYLFWLVGKEPVEKYTSFPIEDGEERKKVSKNLTRLLKYSDDGKELKCVANHLALGISISSTYKLNVCIIPKPGEIQKCEFMIGGPGQIVVTIHETRKLNIEWLIDEEKIPEGANDSTGRFRASTLTVKRQGEWEAKLDFDKVRPEDMAKNYTLTAEIICGQKKGHRVVIAVCCATHDQVTSSPAKSTHITSFSASLADVVISSAFSAIFKTSYTPTADVTVSPTTSADTSTSPLLKNEVTPSLVPSTDAEASSVTSNTIMASPFLFPDFKTSPISSGNVTGFFAPSADTTVSSGGFAALSIAGNSLAILLIFISSVLIYVISKRRLRSSIKVTKNTYRSYEEVIYIEENV